MTLSPAAGKVTVGPGGSGHRPGLVVGDVESESVESPRDEDDDAANAGIRVLSSIVTADTGSHLIARDPSGPSVN